MTSTKLDAVNMMWRTKNGKQIAVEDMNEHHINNTIDMLRQNARILNNPHYTRKASMWIAILYQELSRRRRQRKIEAYSKTTPDIYITFDDLFQDAIKEK